MLELLSLILLGVVSSTLSSLLGIGGGIIIVPFLGALFDLPYIFVIASSLGVIFFNSILNTWNFSRKSSIKFKKVAPIAITSVFSAGLASYFSVSISDLILKWIFLCFVFFFILPISVSSLKGKRIKISILKKNKSNAPILIGLVSGTISGLTGVGGGTILVPLLYNFLKINYKKMPLYTNSIMIFTTFSGVLTYVLSSPIEQINFYSIGYVIPEVVGLIFTGALLGSKLGIFLNRKIPKSKLALGHFIIVMLVVLKSTYLLLSELRG